MKYEEGNVSEETITKLEVNTSCYAKIKAKENLKLVTKNIKNTKHKIAGGIGLGGVGLGTTALASFCIYKDIATSLTGGWILCSSLVLYCGFLLTVDSAKDLKKLKKEEKILEEDLNTAETNYKTKLKNIEDSQNENFNTPDGLFKEEIQKTR